MFTFLDFYIKLYNSDFLRNEIGFLVSHKFGPRAWQICSEAWNLFQYCWYFWHSVMILLPRHHMCHIVEVRHGSSRNYVLSVRVSFSESVIYCFVFSLLYIMCSYSICYKNIKCYKLLTFATFPSLKKQKIYFSKLSYNLVE